MDAVPTWNWLLAIFFLLASAFCSGTETALTALGEARARQLRDEGGRRTRLLGLWIDHPERVLSTILIGNTLVNIGAGALAAGIGATVAERAGWNAGTGVTAATVIATVVILFFGEIMPKTLGKRHPVRFSLAVMPFVRALSWAMWPLAAAVARATHGVFRLFGGKGAVTPAVTSEEIEYLIEMGTREGVLDEVKEELLNSVLEFADRVAKEIMVPRTRMVAIDRDAAQDELFRIVTENPFSRMPVYEGSIDNVVGVLLVREIIQDLRQSRAISLDRYLKPAFFVPEGMKISRLLKEMQRRRTHLAVVVDEFGGTSGLVTLEDVIEEIVGEIQDEGDVEAAPVKAIGPGAWLAEASMPLHDLEAYLNDRLEEAALAAGEVRPPEVRFPEDGDYETLGGFVTATAGRVPPVGATVSWDGLTFAVRAGDERRVTRVEIARRAAEEDAGGGEPPARAAGGA